MTTTSTRRVRLVAQLALSLAMIATVCIVTAPLVLSAQGTGPDTAALRTQVERRYEVLPIREGLVLRPRTANPEARSIEIAGGAIAIDGQPVTGAELRRRLAADADLILQLSYLDEPARRALFSTASSAVPTPAAPPDPATPPAPPVAPAPPVPAAGAPPAPPAPPPAPRRPGRDRDIVRFGGSVTVDEDERIDGDVVVLGGKADIRGAVDGSVVVVGGTMDLGPKATISKDAVVVGGEMHRDPGARIDGEVQEVAMGPLNFRFGRGRGRDAAEWWTRGPWGSAFALAATLVRLAIFALLAALVMLFARDYTERVSARAIAEPIKAGAVGLLAQVLFIPVLVITIVLLAVTIIGIPLLLLVPFAVLGLLVLALVGFTAVAVHVGRLVSARFLNADYGPIATAALGVAVVLAPVILARIIGLAGGPVWFLSMALLGVGVFIEYVAWTVGMGAVALTRFSRGFSGGTTVPGPVTPAGPAGTIDPGGPSTPASPMGPSELGPIGAS